MEKTLELSEAVLEKAKKLGLSQSGVLAEFSRFANQFYIMETYEANEDVWDLMNEIYENNFNGNIHFADFVADAALKGDEIFKNCMYKGKFRCQSLEMTSNFASCYAIRVSG